MKPLPPLLSALALAAGLLTALPAHAVGGLVDVNVIDRDSGATLPVYRHQGEWWIAGRPGARYAIEVRNAAPGRVLGVMAVDGVNVISGDTASWEQTGYVLARRQTAQITGWRKSDAEVAAFHFTALPQSYAARTGRPDHVGVIGVAVFREKAVPPPPPIAPRPWPRDGRFGGGAPAASADAAGPAAESAARQRSPRRPSWAPAMARAKPRTPATPRSSAAARSPTKSSPSATTAART
ncbi:hypothetical protein [Ottowia beijingensis]|uniref:hypothetical protein n=1 Tax=Ottowia beijingensis TaxID=1207057 RepID=UPI00214DDC08|nr:hypothetical protein [Ottowia beijingensis]